MVDRVTEYAQKVVNGEIFCGRLHRLACERHLRDLNRQNTEKFPYHWDAESSERVLEYAETLTIGEGFEKKQVKLMGFQIFDIGSRFGWLNFKNKRRFRRSYKSVARQNGKTLENGIIGTYIAGFSKYKYGKLFTAATKKKQAKLAWDEMKKFIESDEDLQEYFEVKEYCTLIKEKTTNCTIEALSKESGLDDGSRAIFVSIDEYHQHKTNKVYKALYNGTKALSETLVSIITTRGDKINSPCHEMDTYCINILEGIAIAEDFFIDIFSLDPGDDIWDPKNLIKANPFLAANPDTLETLITDMQTAKDMGGSELRDFMVKSLNMWIRNTEDQFTSADKWRECGTDLTLEDMRGRVCYAGLDLSSGGDLTTLHLEFPLENDEFFEYSHSFMPLGRLEEHIETDLAPYDVWENQGLITTTGGSTEFKNDYSFIITFLKDLIENYDLVLKGIGYDPHNADTFLKDLEIFGVSLLEIRQSARFLNDGTEDIQLNIKSKKLKYGKENELLSWSVFNAKIVKNSFGEKKIDKEPNSKNKRIDPVDAMIDAHIAYMKLKEEEKINYEKQMEDYLEKMGWKKRR